MSDIIFEYARDPRADLEEASKQGRNDAANFFSPRMNLKGKYHKGSCDSAAYNNPIQSLSAEEAKSFFDALIHRYREMYVLKYLGLRIYTMHFHTGSSMSKPRFYSSGRDFLGADR